jgi:hypothetical protein
MNEREPRKGEYEIRSACGTPITCYVKGVQLVDFYRTPMILAKDVPPKELKRGVLAGPQCGPGDDLDVGKGTLDGSPSTTPPVKPEVPT